MEPNIKALYEVCAALRNPDEIHDFLQDILTRDEIARLAQRWTVMKHLAEGRSTTQVQQITGASRTTIARASRAVRYGSGMIGKIVERLSEASTPQNQSAAQR